MSDWAYKYFLGFEGRLPSRNSCTQLTISLDKEKSERRAALISDILRAGTIDHSSLDKLIGKLPFAQTTIFGKFARTIAQLLYDMLRAQPYGGTLSDELITNLNWWRHALSSVQSRIVAIRPVFPKYIIYSMHPGRINAVSAG